MKRPGGRQRRGQSRAGAAFRTRPISSVTEGDDILRVSKSKTDVSKFTKIELNNGAVGEGDEEEPNDYQSWVNHNTQAVIQNMKEGPWFTQQEFVKDELERRPDHPDYDPSSLFIP